MGLLDFASTDDGMQALGLLGAAAPSMAPMNFAGRLAQAAQGYQGLKEQSIKLQMSKLQEMRAQQLFEMQKDAYYDSPGGATGSPSAPLGGSAGMPGTMPGQPGQAPTGMPGQPSNGAPPNNLAAELDKARRMAIAQIPGAREIFEILKYKNEPMHLEPGITVNKVTGQVMSNIPYMSQNGQAASLVSDGKGGYSIAAPQGAVDTVAAYERAKSDEQLVDVPDGRGGMRKMYGRDARRLLGGGAPDAPAAPQSVPTTPAAPDAGSSGQMFVLGKNGVQVSPQELMQRIAQIKDPEQRRQSTAIMQQLIKSGGSPAQAPAAPAQTGVAGYVPPASQLEADKATALAPIQIKQKSDEASATGQVANGIAYEKMLTETHRENTSMVLRNREIAPMLDRVTTGQYNQENMVQLGNYIKNSSLAPDWMKKQADKIAGGDVNAAKVLENQLAAAGISTMLATLNKEGSPNRSMFLEINAAKEGLKSGNTTLKDVFALQQRMYDNTAKETSAMLDAKKGGTYDPTIWAQDYAGKRDQMLQTEPAPLPSAALQAQAIPKAQGPAGTFSASVNGKTYTFPNQKALANFKLEAGIK